MSCTSQFFFCGLDSIPFNFLGIAVRSNHRRETTWRPIMDAFKRKLSFWNGKIISFGVGSLSLIPFLIIYPFIFSLFQRSKVIAEFLDKIQRHLLWNVCVEKKGICWVSRKDLCRPKKEGGLGIKDLEAFNVALIRKWDGRAYRTTMLFGLVLSIIDMVISNQIFYAWIWRNQIVNCLFGGRIFWPLASSNGGKMIDSLTIFLVR